MMDRQKSRDQTPYQVGQELFDIRYKGAEVAFVAGSHCRGEATASSDIDLVVVYPHLDHAYRESFFYNGWPVEAFVNDRETLNYFFIEDNVKDGTPSLLCMVVEGQPLPESHPWVFELKSLADRVLDAGPPVFSEDQFRNLRYGISDLLDDLKSPRNEFEAKTIVAKLHEKLGDFWFRAQGKWSASGKHIPRRMRKLDPSFSEKWINAFELAFSGNQIEVVKLTESFLDQYGGYIFDNYRRNAPQDWRRTIKENRMNESSFEQLETQSGLTDEESHFNHQNLGRIKIRLAKFGDVPKLRKLLNAAYKRLADMGLNFNATFQDDDLTADGIVDGRTFVMDRQGEIIATMKLRHRNVIDERPCLYVGRFAVQPDLQSQGLGIYLLNLAEKLAKREGCSCIQLDTAQPAEHLVKFYKGNGFKIMKPTYFEGKTYCSWVMEKQI